MYAYIHIQIYIFCIIFQGVVIIEELERAKIVLERSDTSQELKVDTLRHLKRKRPAKEVLMKTQIG